MFTRLLKDKKGGVGGLLIGLAVTIVVIGAIVGGAIGYLLNTTPAKLGVEDVEIMNGETLASLGFADTKIKDIIKQFKELAKADTSKVVQNAPTEQDKKAADDGVSDGATTEGFVGEDGGIDYSMLLTSEITYDERYVKAYTDAQLASILDSIVKDGVTDAMSGDGAEGVQFLSSINANVNEITITQADDKTTLRAVMSVDSSKIKDKLKDSMGAAYSLLKNSIPDVIYVVSYFEVTANAETPEKLLLTSVDMKINDTENALSKALFRLFAASAAEADEDVSEMSEAEQKALINDTVGNAFVGIIYNLGDLATTDGSNIESGTNKVLNASLIVPGADAIGNGKITLITRTAA